MHTYATSLADFIVLGVAFLLGLLLWAETSLLRNISFRAVRKRKQVYYYSLAIVGLTGYLALAYFINTKGLF